MSSPETAGANTPPLAQEWLYALRYWLRRRNGVIALVVLAVVIGGALNWSWLVAVGIAPLVIAVLPCAAMCALGLCMHRMGAARARPKPTRSRRRSPDAQVMTSLDAGERGLLLFDKSTLPDEPTASPAVSFTEFPKPRGKELT